jgi:archaellum component FlaF (FlaF/FlaG flagellin family)
MFKAKKRRALSGIVTSAILLSAVSVMGIMIVFWANSNLQTHQAELDQTFADNHNKINERILIEHVWFGSSGPSINITMSNTGTLGLNITSVKIQDVSFGQLWNFTYTDGGIIRGDELSLNETMSPAWVSDREYQITITTDRGNIYKTEVLSP